MDDELGVEKSPDNAAFRLARADDMLDRWEATLGLPPLKAPRATSEVHRLLDLSVEEIGKLDPDECAIAVIVLSQFATYVSRTHQRLEARQGWCYDEITKAIADRVSQQKGYSYEERRPKAIAEHDGARALEQLRALAQAQAKRLSWMANRIEGVAAAYENFSNVRRRQRQAG